MAELNLRKRGDKWEYYFEAAKTNGKRNRVSKGGFQTKKEASAAGTKALHEYNGTGLITKEIKMSVSDYLEQWMNDYCLLNLKPSTNENYNKLIRRHINPMIGDCYLNAVTGKMLQELINNLCGKNLSRGLITNVKGILSKSFKYAVSPLHYLKTSPAVDIVVPKMVDQISIKSRPHCFLSSDNIKKIFERFPYGSPVYIPMLLGYRCGLRLGEAYGVTWEDINFQNKTLTVTHQIQYENKKKWYITSPKYGSSRTIDLDDDTINILLRTKEEQKNSEECYKELYCHPCLDDTNTLGVIGTPIHFINVRPDGEYILPKTMMYASQVIHKELQCPEFTFHSLRHTHCSMLIEKGFALKYVQTRLGHKSIDVTLEIYNHLTPNQATESRNKLSTIF